MISNSGTTSLGLYDFKRQIDAFGGVDYFRPTLAGGYLPNARVMLNNGEIVQNGTNGNLTNDPNTNMTGWKKNNSVQVVNTIADLLAISNLKDGDVVYVKSYYEPTNLALSNPYKGGGRFIYVSGLSNLNDGVSVIDGWVRDTSSKQLTTDDAGLIGDGNDANATVRLQSVFSAADDGFTIQIIGKYTINQHVMAYRKKDLKIVGVDSDIQGDPDNWTWSTSHIVADVPWYHPGGMLMAYECPNVVFDSLKIKGINRPNLHAGADQWQDGDCSLGCYKCPNPKFSNNVCTNNYAWGIVSVGGSGGTAYDNTVSYCTHQSGINICSQSTGGITRVYNNTITECGLYGIEYESINPINLECYSNFVENCYVGILLYCYTHTVRGKVHNNTVEGCLTGISPTDLYNEQNGVTLSQNSVKNTEYAFNITNANSININNNVANGFFNKDTYLHISPSNFIAEVFAPNQFLTHGSLVTEFGAVVGSVYYVEGRQITITAIATNTAPWAYGNTDPADFSIITIAESILDSEFLFKHLKKKYLAGARCYMGIQSLGANKNNIFSGNTISGFAYGFVKDRASTDAQFNEVIAGNTFVDGATDVLNPSSSMGVKYIDNNFSANLNFHRDLVEQGNVTLEPIISQKLGIARATTSEAVKSATIYLPQKTRINAVSISVIGMNTTGKLRVTINGNMVEALNTGTTTTIACNLVLSVGANTVTISDSVGNLTYTDIFLSLLSA